MRLLAWCLRRLVGIVAERDTRGPVLADLDEEFAIRRGLDGLTRARRWYVSQTFRSLWPLVERRFVHRRADVDSTPFGRLHLELGQATRALARAPGYAAITTLTLALGIGVSTAAFTAVSAALLRPLPYSTEARLAVLAETRGTSEISVSYPDFLDWQAHTAAFDALAAFRGYSGTLTGGDVPERVRGQVITSNLLSVLGVAPRIGQPFDATADRPGAARTVLLGDGLWRRRFGARQDILGTTLHLDGLGYAVIGVMPRGFNFPDGIVYAAPDLYLPIGPFADADLATRGSHTGLEAIGLLKPGITLDRARDDVARLQSTIVAAHPDADRGVGVRMERAVTVIVGDLRDELRTVWSASLVLLFIACANVAGLTLTRAVSRRQELALRVALGGSRTALVATLLAEHVIVAIGGTAAGLALALGLTSAARRYVTDLPRLTNLYPDGRVLGFAMALLILTTVLASVAPLAWLGKASLDPWLRARGQSHRGWRLRRGLVGAQVALALTLVSSAGLLGRSLVALHRRSGGIVSTGVLTFDLRLPERTAGNMVAPFYQDLYTRLSAAPTVMTVGGISTLPFTGSGSQSAIRPKGGTAEDDVRTDVAVVTAQYFSAMGVAMLRGRPFDARDGVTGPPVAIVDDRFATHLWPGRDPIGQHVAGWGFDDLVIVGVVAHVDNYGVGSTSREELYVPLTERPALRFYTVIRSTGDPTTLGLFARQTVAAMDSALAIGNMQTMDLVVDRTVAGPRLAAAVGVGFGALALLLAAVGMYGLVAYAVELRRREAGIRLALGAEPNALVRLVTRETGAAVMAGGLIGLAGSVLAGLLLRSQLVDVRPYDPLVFIGSTVALTMAAAVSTWWPARRLGRVSPAVALEVD
jgi:putative ABC transport system permease protein